MQMQTILFYFVWCLSVASVKSHSWAHCTDYDGTISGQDFDESKCNGYIREWSSKWGATSFGADRGVNYFGSNGAWCQSSFSSNLDSMYDTNQGYPMATWNIGETVTIVWPAKNHANYECFNYIPDTRMKLFYNPSVNPSSELSSLSDWEELVDFQEGCTAGQDGCGFQNCPKFCENTDKAPCFGDYKVSRNDFPTDGYYTIMWYWLFNASPVTPYTTCFEVYVTSDGGSPGTDTTTDTDTITITDTTTDTTDTTDTVDTFDSGTNIVIENKDGINQWWFALYLRDVADGYKVDTVEIKDSKLGYYVTGEYKWYGAYVFQSSQSNGWVTPFDVRISSTDGQTLEAEQLITNTIEYSEFDFGSNFGAGDTCSSCSCDCTSSSSTKQTSSSRTSASVVDTDSDSESGMSYYAISVPICYTGAVFDKTSLVDGANAAYDGSGIAVNWTIMYEYDDMDASDGFNVTIVTETSDPSSVNAIAYSYETDTSALCDSIEQEYTVGSCAVCDPGAMTTIMLEENFNVNNNNNGGGSASTGMSTELVIGLIALCVVILVGVMIAIVCVRRCRKQRQQPQTAAGQYLFNDN